MENLKLSRRYYQLLEEAKEHFYALQTNIQFSGEDLKVIAVSSTLKNEGKTTTAVGLSYSLAKSGYKVLLLDVDIRNSILTGIFNARDRVVGLTEYLSGKSDLEEVIRKTDVDGLSVIESGPISPNPIGLLRSKRFEKIFQELRQEFDYIIVDTPPIGQVIDAAIIVQQCDASFLVTELGRVTRTQLLHSKQQLDQTGVPFLGVVTNKDSYRKDSYGYYGEYGQYGSDNHSQSSD